MATDTDTLRPQDDLTLNIGKLAECVTDIAVLRARYLDLTAWWSAWEAVLRQALAEAVQGQTEGFDEVRESYFKLIIEIAEAASRFSSRTMIGEVDAAVVVAMHPLFRSLTTAWQAFVGCQQGIAWAGDQYWTSGRMPILSLSETGASIVRTMKLNPLEQPVLSRTALAMQFNALAGQLIWRE